MARFILVHGMFHGGWAWERVSAKLRAAGHFVSAPDLAGCGNDTTPPGEVTLDRWSSDIAAQVEVGEGATILVGHSRGGFVISQVAERVPDRLAALVFASAMMLPTGTGPMGIYALVHEQGMKAPPPSVMPVPNTERTALLPPENASDVFYGSATEADRHWAMPQLTAEPLRPLTETLSITDERYGSVPRVYIETTKDRTLPIEAQRAMIARTPVDRVYTLETDHMLNLLAVDEMVAILQEVAARYDD